MPMSGATSAAVSGTDSRGAYLRRAVKNKSLSLVLVGALSLFATLAMPVYAANPWNPMISIVWPHDTAGNTTPVAGSQLVNVSVWPSNLVMCNTMPDPSLSLMVGSGNDPAAPVAANSTLQERNIGTSSEFPSMEFNNDVANLAADPSGKFRFITFVSGLPDSNVWVHAADARTIFPNQLLPTGVSALTPDTLDARIQIVYPHDDAGNLATVDNASKVNLAVDLFQHGTTLSVPMGSIYQPRLYYSIGTGDIQQGPVANIQRTYTVGTNAYPRWELDNFPVTPGQQYHFMFALNPIGQAGAAYPSIWTHAEDARTILPNPTAPPTCAR